MHSNLRPLTRDDKILFLHDQKRFSKEEFDVNLIDLSAAPLSFMPGYQLIQAKIRPQPVTLAGGDLIKIEVESQSYFLYNPTTDNLTRMIIPLEPNSPSVFAANGLLGVKLTKDTVIDYVKYFGLVVEGEHGQSFIFLDNEAEIPWSETVDKATRDRLVGMLSARSPRLSDGRFDVKLTEEGSWLLGPVFRLTLPCIYKQIPFSTRVSVTPSGVIAMDQDYPVDGENTFRNISRTLPYYRIEPTSKLKQLMLWRRIRQLPIAVTFVLMFLATGILALAGNLLMIAGLTDLVIGAFSTEWTTRIDGFLREYTTLLQVGLVGAVIGLLFSAVLGLLSWASEALGRQRPGVLRVMYDTMRSRALSRYSTTPRRVRGLVLTAFLNIVTLFTTWGCIFYAMDARGFDVFISPAELNLRSSVGFAFEQALGWFARGDIGFVRSFFSSFTPVKELSVLGSYLRSIMLLTIPLLLIWNLKRFWTLTTPEENNP